MSGVPRWARALLNAASALVPGRRREAWRRQWEGEVAHFARRRRGLALLGFTLGAWVHAAYLVREEVRGMGTLGDLRTSLRSLLRRPGLVALSVVTLGVGIGAATAVFSMSEAVLFRPLPLPDGDRLFALFSTNHERGFDRFSVSYPDFVDWTSRADLFASASVYAETSRDLAGDAEPVRLTGVLVHDGFFETLGAEAVVGRLLDAGDQSPRSDPAIVLSAGVWSRVFGAEPGVLGRTVRLDGEAYTVVGVAPAGATWPLDADFWIPLRAGSGPAPGMERRSNHAWQAIARLRPGVDVAVASAQVAAVARGWYASNAAGTNEEGTAALVVPLRASVAGDEGSILFGVMGIAVLVVLLIACINQSNLLLTHGLARARELSLRAALGAGRARLFTLLLGESVALSVAGGALGLAFAVATVRIVVARSPLDLPTLADAGLDVPVLLGALAISLVASVLAGLVPAAKASRTSLAEALKEGARQTSAGRGGARLRRVLVAVELALSVVLLTSAGLAIRTFRMQLAADPGFRVSNALVFSVRLPAARYGDEATSRQFWDEAVRRLAAVPGVVGAGMTSRLPVGASRGSLYRVFLVDGAPEPPAGSDVGAMWVSADPSYLPALGVRPLRGRAFTEEDGAGALPVMVVSASFAGRISPDQEILGRRIRSWRDENVLRTVVGVVPDIQLDGMAGEPEPAVFVPAAQDARRSASFLVRTASDPATVVPAVRAVMTDLDPDVALAGMSSLDDAHLARLAGIRFVMTLFGLFGTLALVLAVVGVYGLVAHSVSQRTPEIGIRLAMGATGADVQGRVVGEGLLLAAVGIGVGLAVSVALARVASSFVFGLGWLDVRTFTGVAALLGGATVLASWVPARRVLRVDPVEALRRE